MSSTRRLPAAAGFRFVVLMAAASALAPAFAQTGNFSEYMGYVPGQIRQATLPTIALWRDATVVSLFGSLWIGDTGPAIDPERFGFIPDQAVFHPPAPKTGGDGFRAPARKDFWLAFTALNSTDADDWALSYYVSDIRAKELVIVSESGRRESWAGDRLAAMERQTRFTNISSLRVPLPPSERRTLYVRVQGWGAFLSEIRLWRHEALAPRLASIASLGGILAGGMAVLCVFSMLMIGMAGRKHVPYAAFSCLAFIFVLVSLQAGGSTVLTRGGPGGRFAIDVLLLSMSLAIDAMAFPWSRRPKNQRVAGLARRGLAMMAVGLSSLLTRSLAPHLVAMAVFAASSMALAGRGVFRLTKAWNLESFGDSLLAIVAAGAGVGISLEFRPPSGGDALWAYAMPIALFMHTTSFTFLAAIRWMRFRLSAAAGYRAAFERLARQVKSRETFAISTAKAFLAPLDGLIGLLDEALEPAVGNSQGGQPGDGVSKVLALARAETIRLSSLANNVLVYMRVRRNEFRLSDEPFNLAALLRATLNLTSHLVTGRNLETRLEVPIIEMRNDVLAVQQVVYNVLGRAMRTPGVSSLAIRAESDTHLVHLDISDDGDAPADLATSGSSPSLAMVMMSGVRLDGASEDTVESREEREPLDMVVTARLSSLLGGSFSWSREGNRNRYSFVFPRSMRWIPAGDASGSGEPAGEHIGSRSFLDGSPSSDPATIGIGAPAMRGQEAAGGKSGAVLVVDDEPLSLFSLKRRLESDGWSVDARVSASDALADLEIADAKKRYALILVDASMPEMSGFAFCERVRSVEAREFLPVILVIDSMRPEDVERTFQSGANDYLVRPVGGRELLARVRTHVDLARGVRMDLERGARMAEIDKFKTLGWLTAGVAHEINTPNNAILRNVPLLKELWAEIMVALERLYRSDGEFNVRGFSYEDLRREIPEILSDLYMGAQHIKKIVADLKDYARGSSEAALEPTDLNQVVSYAARLLKHTIATSTNSAVFTFFDNLPSVMADRLKLTQVVVNIMENALQALPDASRGIAVSTGVEEAPSGETGWVCVRIRDEGIGMDTQTLSSVFHPFFTTKHERGGTGLGMPVAAGIVRDLGGMIELHSSPGTGTEVILRLPIPAGSEGNGQNRGKNG